MRGCARKSTPEVKNGKVQKKNDWSLTPNYDNHAQREVVIDRKRPGKGYRHLLKPRDIRTFIGLLPDWEELSIGLNAIVLSPGDWERDGYYRACGVVAICAWDEERWIEYSHGHYEDHRAVFQRLGVPCEQTSAGYVLCKFEEDTARAYQLLHILLHELGHHHDRMTTQSRRHAGRGEGYAEEYALRYEALIWDRYRQTFDL